MGVRGRGRGRGRARAGVTVRLRLRLRVSPLASTSRASLASATLAASLSSKDIPPSGPCNGARVGTSPVRPTGASAAAAPPTVPRCPTVPLSNSARQAALTGRLSCSKPDAIACSLAAC